MSDFEDDRIEIGLRLLALRHHWRYGQNQGGFAALCGISQSSLGNYENGDRRPSIDQIARIKKATGATSDWLLFGDEQGLPVVLASALKEELKKLKKARR